MRKCVDGFRPTERADASPGRTTPPRSHALTLSRPHAPTHAASRCNVLREKPLSTPFFLFAFPSPWLYNEPVHAEPRAPVRRRRTLGPESGSVGRKWEMGRWARHIATAPEQSGAVSENDGRNKYGGPGILRRNVNNSC